MNKEFVKLMEKWDDLSWKLSDYGAADTEPTVVFENLLMQYITKGKNLLPLNADQWQLYTCTMDCDDAASQLNDYVQEVFNLIDSMKHHEVMEISEYYDF